MNERPSKRPPSGGVRYSTTAELQKRIAAISNINERIPKNGHKAFDRKYYDQIKHSLVQVDLALGRAMNLPNEKAYFYLNEVQALLRGLLEQVYELSLGFHRNMLKQFGLLPVLLWYIETYNVKTNIRVNFRHHSLIRDFSMEISETAYNIIKETLENISHGATESEVTVEIRVDEEVLKICIWNHSQNSSLGMASASSIRGLEEQVRALGGRIYLNSSSGPATGLVADLPLSRHLSDIKLTQ